MQIYKYSEFGAANQRCAIWERQRRVAKVQKETKGTET